VIVDELAYGANKSYERCHLASYLPEDSLPLLSLASSPPTGPTQLLPISPHRTYLPSWRATIELVTPHSSTSYQGELDPFPVPGSLLTLSPLLQISDSLMNFVLLLNLEKFPAKRRSMFKVFNLSQSYRFLREFEIVNNSINVIRLDNLGLEPRDLPIGICADMSAIPLYLTIADDARFLSLEHTHPPASYVIHGRRWEAQRLLKNLWFSRLQK